MSSEISRACTVNKYLNKLHTLQLRYCRYVLYIQYFVFHPGPIKEKVRTIYLHTAPWIVDRKSGKLSHVPLIHFYYRYRVQVGPPWYLEKKTHSGTQCHRSARVHQRLTIFWHDLRIAQTLVGRNPRTNLIF